MFYDAAMRFGDDHLQIAKKIGNGKYARDLNKYANQKLSGYNGGVAHGQRI